MRERFRMLLPLVGLLLVPALLPALAAERVALVVGNAAYQQEIAKLRNPVNDATAVGRALRRLGFEVIEGTDLNEDSFYDKIIAFDDAARGAKLALFFYAGHGLQVDGRNYLAPVDLKLERKQDLRRHAIELVAVLEVMRSETNLVILDACRNNPLARELARSLGLSRAAVASRGLARVESASGTLIAYATEPGSVAADGTGDNSPYTEALLEHLETPGLSVQDLFTEVTASVLASTGEKQKPWTHSSLSKIVRLVPGDESEATAVTPAPAPASEPASTRLTAEQLAAERLFWESVKDSEDVADIQAYLDKYPGGEYEALARNRLRRLQGSGPAADSAVVPPQAPLPAVPSPESVEASLGLERSERRLIQLGLAAEGFDPGPADGLFGRGTRGAIGRWQGSRGGESTGYLDAESARLLLASGRKRESQEQARRDAEARARQQAAAEAERRRLEREAQEKASADDAAYAQAKSRGTVESYDKYLRAYSSGRHAGEARRLRAEAQKRREDPLRQAKETISKALTAAQRIEHDFQRYSVFRDIASAQARAGNVREALATTQRIENTEWRAWAFGSVARVLAEAGNVPEALSTAQRIEDASGRAYAFVHIARMQAEAGNVREAERSISKALSTVQKIEQTVSLASVVVAIARVQAEAGNIREAERSLSKALEAAQRIDSEYARAVSFGNIARAQVEAGNVREAERSISKALATAQATADAYLRVQAFADIAKVQAEAGNVREAERSLSKALATVQRIENASLRNQAFIDIASAQAEAGNVRGALATTQRIEGTYSWRDHAFAAIAKVQAEAGNIQEALAIAQRIEGGSLPPRPHVLADIARAQAEAGNVREAQRTLSKALLAAQQVEDGGYRAQAFADIASAQAEAGNVREALATAQRIEDAGFRAQAFANIASAQAQIAVAP